MWKIYKFTNKTYNEKEKCYKSYIGLTRKNIEQRFHEHATYNQCKVFHAAIKKYGKDSWTHEILENNIQTEIEALERESFYIEKHNSLAKNGKGYNIYLYNSRKIINGKIKCYGKCGKYKTIEHFTKNKKYELGIDKICKDCKNEKARNSNNKPKIRQQKKQYRLENKSSIADSKIKRCQLLSENNKNLSLKEKCDITPEKFCFTCKITKPTTEFGIRNRRADGFSGSCKDCISKGKREKRVKILGE